jgi:hypothetical protein
MDVLKHLDLFKTNALKEESQMMSNFLDAFSGKGNKKGMEDFRKFVKSGKLSVSTIENDNFEEITAKLKNSLIEKIKSQEEHFFCFGCQKLTDLITLDCHHKLCSACFINLISYLTDGKFVLNIIEKKEITCSFTDCNKKIQDHIQRKYIPDYQKYEEDAEKRLSFVCSKCKEQGKLDVFQTSCHHYCEACTVGLIRSGKRNCPDCDVPYSNEELRLFAEKTKKCEGCYDHKNWIKEFPQKLCAHFVCIQCLSENQTTQQCFISENCPNYNLNPIEFQQLFKFKCKNCPSMIYKSSPYWFNKNCQCLYCEDCQLKLSNNNFNNCYGCNTRLNKETQIVLQEKHKSNMNEPTKVCPICQKSIRISEMVSLSGCVDEFCKTCVEEYVKTCVGDVSMMDQLNKCMVCQAEIPAFQLESVIGIEAYTKFMFYILQKQNVPIIKCPSCKAEFEAGFQRKVECINCNHIFCKQCNYPYHEDGNCQENFLQQRIEEMENMEGGVTQCPRCRFPYIKDPKNCEHVDCLQPGCGISFCFKCGCLRSPTLEHGNHYHRKECPFYAPIEQKFIHVHKDLGKRDCIECQRLGYKHLGEQHCQPPKSLRVNRRVDPDEVE